MPTRRAFLRSASRYFNASSKICLMTSSPANIPIVLRQSFSPWPLATTARNSASSFSSVLTRSSRVACVMPRLLQQPAALILSPEGRRHRHHPSLSRRPPLRGLLVEHLLQEPPI